MSGAGGSGEDEPVRTPSPEDAALSRRLRDLDRRLDERRPDRGRETAPEAAPRPGIGMALRLGADFVAGVVVGARAGLGFRRAARDFALGPDRVLPVGVRGGHPQRDAYGRHDRQKAGIGRRSGIPPVRLTRVKVATDPIHQFEIKKLIPIEIGGVDFSFTNSALFMVIDGRRRVGVPDPVDARPRPGAGPLAVGGGGDLRVHRQDAPGFGRQRRHAVLPLRLHRSSCSSCSPT